MTHQVLIRSSIIQLQCLQTFIKHPPSLLVEDVSTVDDTTEAGTDLGTEDLGDSPTSTLPTTGEDVDTTGLDSPDSPDVLPKEDFQKKRTRSVIEVVGPVLISVPPYSRNAPRGMPHVLRIYVPSVSVMRETYSNAPVCFPLHQQEKSI